MGDSGPALPTAIHYSLQGTRIGGKEFGAQELEIQGAKRLRFPFSFFFLSLGPSPASKKPKLLHGTLIIKDNVSVGKRESR